MRCVCCGAALVCNESFLCSTNGCFLRWLKGEGGPYSGDAETSMAEFTCDRWVAHHGSPQEES